MRAANSGHFFFLKYEIGLQLHHQSTKKMACVVRAL